MSVEMNFESILATAVVAAVGAIGGFLTAVLNRGPKMQAAVDNRLEILIDGYEKRVVELTDHIKRLELKISDYEQQISELTSLIHDFKTSSDELDVQKRKNIELEQKLRAYEGEKR